MFKIISTNNAINNMDDFGVVICKEGLTLSQYFANLFLPSSKTFCKTYQLQYNTILDFSRSILRKLLTTNNVTNVDKFEVMVCKEKSLLNQYFFYFILGFFRSIL